MCNPTVGNSVQARSGYRSSVDDSSISPKCKHGSPTRPEDRDSRVDGLRVDKDKVEGRKRVTDKGAQLIM